MAKIGKIDVIVKSHFLSAYWKCSFQYALIQEFFRNRVSIEFNFNVFFTLGPKNSRLNLTVVKIRAVRKEQKNHLFDEEETADKDGRAE